jgi:hypothetical protein
MLQTDTRKLDLELAIIQGLAQVGACTFDDLCAQLPLSYTWDQVFSEVDRLRRAGTITLIRAPSLDYIVSLTPRQTAEAHHLTPG